MILVVGGTKGGSGKTLLATNLIVIRAQSGQDVLLIDADDQASVTLFTRQREQRTEGKPLYTAIQSFEADVIAQVRSLASKYDDIDPSIAMRRIIERGDDIQPHENYSDLRNLQAEFGRVLEEASRYGFEIVRINTNTKNLKEVVDEMETVLQTRFSLDTRNRMQN